MKNIALAFTGFLFVLIISSCSKTQSGDAPLTPIRKNAVLVTTENNSFISYDATTGTKLWEKSLKGKATGSPTIYKGKVYSVSDNGTFTVIELATGKTQIEITTLPASSNATYIYNDRIYIAGNNLFCYDLNGNFKWVFKRGFNFKTAPTVKNDYLYATGSDTCYKIKMMSDTAWAVWVYPTPTNAVIQGSPTVINGIVYFGADDKKIYAVYDANASLKWSYATNDVVLSSPMAYGGMCIAGSNDYHVYSVDSTTGQLRWKIPTKERVFSSPCIHEFSNTIFIGSYDFNLYAIDHVSGTVKWKYPAGSIIKSSPVVFGDYVYFTSFDKYLYCVNVYTGLTVWKSFINANSQSSPIVDDLNNGAYPGISGHSKY